VVCREHSEKSKFSDLKPHPVCICSHHPCPTAIPCFVCDAARATSAAPTYFPVAKLPCPDPDPGKDKPIERWFVDGGIDYNNPSFATFDHYTEAIRVKGSWKRVSVGGTAGVRRSHGNMDFSKLRIINIGTGSKGEQVRPRRRDILASLIPTQIRMGLFLKTTLTELAVGSEKTAEMMETLASFLTGEIRLVYERFSANNELVWIKLDKYKQLDEITRRTEEYLEDKVVQSKLNKVSKEIADEYIHRIRNANTPAAAPRGDVPTSTTGPPPNIVIPTVNYSSSHDVAPLPSEVTPTPRGEMRPNDQIRADNQAAASIKTPSVSPSTPAPANNPLPPSTPTSPTTRPSPTDQRPPNTPTSPTSQLSPDTQHQQHASSIHTPNDARPTLEHVLSVDSNATDASSLNPLSAMNSDTANSKQTSANTTPGSTYTKVVPVEIDRETDAILPESPLKGKGHADEWSATNGDTMGASLESVYITARSTWKESCDCRNCTCAHR
jgi:hypothetical protein